jgi:hypothetical protein
MSKLNTNSNSYIIIYSAILVVVVAFLLAFIFKELKPMQDYPVTDVWGKPLKAPRTAKDTQGEVAADYQTDQEKQWVEKLRKKFSVEVYEDVVKTVNKH